MLVRCTTEPLQRKIFVSRHGVDWAYLEDVPGKPGWICDNSSEGIVLNGLGSEPEKRLLKTRGVESLSPRSISFRVKLLRIQPILKVTLLMSYDSRMGTLKCCVNTYGPQYCHSIDTHWSDHASQFMTVDMPFPDFPSFAGVPEKSFLKEDLICIADRGKVKVIGMQSC